MKNLATLILLIFFASNTMAEEQENKAEKELATFAGGCFWCMEPPFEKLEGVESVISGYSGGDEVKPTYEQVSSWSN